MTSVEGAGYSQENAVLIPCRPDQFGEFIAGLFDADRVIFRVYYCEFVQEFRQLWSTISLIQQRISDQQDFSLVKTEIDIEYLSGKVYRLSSLDQLREYNELDSEKCTSISFHFTYLVRIPGSSIPKKQEIELYYFTGERAQVDHEQLAGESVAIKMVTSVSQPKGAGRKSGISYFIRHTHISWGHDISHLLDREIERARIQNKLADNIGKYRNGILVALCGVMAVVVMRVVSKFVSSTALRVKEGEGVNAAVQRLLLEGNLIESHGVFTIYSILILGTLIFFASEVIRTAASRAPSFLILSEHAQTEAAKGRASHRKRLIIKATALFGTIILAISTSIVAGELAAFWRG